MSATEVKQYFDDYIFGFVFADLEREIAFVKSQVEIVGGFRVPKIIGGSNFLGALDLLCYTEFMGGILTGSFSRGSDKSRFDAFFNTLGPDYKAFNQRINVYKVFRCGMVHEYFVKKSAVVYMLDGKVNQWATSDGVGTAVSGAPSMLMGPSTMRYRHAG